jgi:hypothetical protein
MVGALAAVPLVLATHWSWGQAAGQSVPAITIIRKAQVWCGPGMGRACDGLELCAGQQSRRAASGALAVLGQASSAALQRNLAPPPHLLQVDEAEPWLSNMTAGHMAALVLLDVMPSLLLLLPALQGAVAATITWYGSGLEATNLLQEGDPVITPAVAASLALGAAATVAGLVRNTELSIKQEEHQVVREAVSNAGVCRRGAPGVVRAACPMRWEWRTACRCTGLVF